MELTWLSVFRSPSSTFVLYGEARKLLSWQWFLMRVVEVDDVKMIEGVDENIDELFL